VKSDWYLTFSGPVFHFGNAYQHKYHYDYVRPVPFRLFVCPFRRFVVRRFHCVEQGYFASEMRLLYHTVWVLYYGNEIKKNLHNNMDLFK